MSTNIGSQIRLHGVKLFDEAMSVAGGTAGRYGRAPAILVLVKGSEHLVLIVFSVTFLPSA